MCLSLVCDGNRHVVQFHVSRVMAASEAIKGLGVQNMGSRKPDVPYRGVPHPAGTVGAIGDRGNVEEASCRLRSQDGSSTVEAASCRFSSSGGILPPEEPGGSSTVEAASCRLRSQVAPLR